MVSQERKPRELVLKKVSSFHDEDWLVCRLDAGHVEYVAHDLGVHPS